MNDGGVKSEHVESVSLQIMEIKVDSPDISAFYKDQMDDLFKFILTCSPV